MGKMEPAPKSFKIKVLIPIVSIFVATVAIIAVINYTLLSSTVKTRTDTSLELFTSSIMAQITHLDIVLDEATQTLNEKNIAIAKAVAYILEHTSADKEISEYIRLAELLDIIELDVADKDGYIVYSNLADYIGWNYQSTDATKGYMELVDGKITMLPEMPRKDEISGNFTHYSGVTRTDDKGFIQLGFDANIIAHIEQEMSVQIAIEETVIGDNGYGVVLENGVIRAHPDRAMIGLDVSSEEWCKTVSAGNGFGWITVNNGIYYVGYKNIDGRTIIGLLPQKDFYKELNSALIYTVILFAIAIAIMITVVYLVLGKLLSPVKSLSYGLDKIAKGDLDARIEGNYNDEFDVIKDAVNSMAVGIKSYIIEKLQAEQAAHESELAKGRAEAAREAIMESISYASKIQKNLLPPDILMRTVFSDFSAVWKPRDVVGGDIYWAKDFYDGVLLCVADCTGHGTPGALLTMLVVSTFDTTVTEKNHNDTAEILYTLDRRLASVLNVDAEGDKNLGIMDINDGCDLAVLFVAKDGGITLSAGHTNVFMCDGKETKRYSGQKIFVGEGKIAGKDKVNTVNIPANPDCKFYIATDGMSDQKGGERNRAFGYKIFERIVLENHNEPLSVITDKVWAAFEEYRGDEQRRDDFELIAFKP